MSAFFGQFVSHDLSLDPRTRLARPADPFLTTNHRTPWLDLDSVYAAGPPALHFDPKDPALLIVGSNGQYEDVPRAPDGTTMTFDLRNDDTLMLSALHAAFLRFHNHVVERLRASGVTSFAAYRREVVWHYQWIIRHEYLAGLVEPGTCERATGLAPSGTGLPGTGLPGTGLPVELQIALRFGHAQLRPAYQVNNKLTAYLFSPDNPDLRGGCPGPDRYVDWRELLATNARPIRRSVCTPLFRLPRHANPAGDLPVSLPQRDLLRHLTWQIPSGQAIATALGIPVLPAADLAELQPYGLDRSTPLWYYLLAEAEVVTAGATLGPLGSRLLAETMLGPLADPSHAAPADWRPTLPSATPNHFTLADLFALAGVLDR
ncbi:peroxidase family protein [Kribbella solani]|uniref:peroxidase family protein n=1 Tax=Kribbella solani TaxID=236067 RepID=UPI0029B650E7|nr:peroxidase family protein [Kribbella solani]MDX2973083.1 peroxidase family protein [Kribbella solani]